MHVSQPFLLIFKGAIKALRHPYKWQEPFSADESTNGDGQTHAYSL